MNIVTAFRDRAVRRVMKFGIPAAIGKLLSSVAGLVTMALLARSLGPGPFGVIAMMRTVVAVVDQFANFNTWQVMVTYGTEAIANNRRSDVQRLIKLCIVIDLCTGWLAAVVVAGVAFIVPSAFGWTTHEAALCALYGITLATRVQGASDGIFRIADAYRAQAIALSLSAGLIMASAILAVAFGASFSGFVLLLVGGEVAGNFVVTTVAFLVARDQGYGGWLRSPLAGVRSAFPGIVRFLAATNAQLTVKRTYAELDMVIVGSVLGKVASGLFRVVKQLGTIPGRIFMPFEQVVFTELARAAANEDYTGFRRLLYRFSGLVAMGSLAIWMLLAIFAEHVITAVASDAFIAAVPPFRIYMLAMVLLVANAPVMRAIVALGRPGTLLWFELATLAVLAIALVIGAHEYGLQGVAGAVLLHRLIQLTWSFWLVERVIAKRQRGDSTSRVTGAPSSESER